MTNDIRQAVRLSPELEDETFDLQGEAFELLEAGNSEEALEKIKLAWEMLPEPKFNTSCSHVILCDLIEILNFAGQYDEAKKLLENWIADMETSGYKIYETTPYILYGETLLFINKPNEAKEAFYQATKYGATKRDFSDKPNFYFDVARKKITDEQEILTLFKDEVLSKQGEKKNKGTEELSEEVSERIEELSEQGSSFFDEDNFEQAIAVWKQALALIPSPQNTYAETLWLESSIGDAYFMLNDHESSLHHFINAKGNIETNAYENPFVMLRLGELYVEKNDTANAKEYLLRAYMLEGEEIFEDEDDKYFGFLKTHVELK